MNELEWLAEQRPEVMETDDETTAYARTALLAYAMNGAGIERPVAGARRPSQATGLRPTVGMLLGPAVAPPQRGCRLGRRRPVALAVTAAAVFAIAVVVAAGALPFGDGPQIAKRIAPTVAEAAPLVKLAKRIRQQPAPSGDATLVFRTHRFPEVKGFTGADLYLDDGRYYFGATLEELKAVKEGEDIGEGVPKREHDAAVAANDLEPPAAREAMIDATWAGGHRPTAAENQASSARNLKILKRGADAGQPAHDRQQPDLDRRHGHADLRCR